MAQQTFPEGGKPQGFIRRNPHGSLLPVMLPDSQEAEITRHLALQIVEEIFDTYPAQYGRAIEFLLKKETPRLFSGGEASWTEMGDQRVALIVDDGASPEGTVLTAAQIPVPGASVNATIPTTAGMLRSVGINVQLHFRGGGWGTVTAKNEGTGEITITSTSGLGLPAIVQGDIITIGAEHRADGMRRIVNNNRYEPVNRTNFIPTYMKAMEFGRREWLARKNGSTTNLPEMEEKNLIRDLLAEVTTEFWNGVKGVKPLAAGDGYALGQDGIKTQMINGGSQPNPVTVAGLQDAIETVLTGRKFKSGNIMMVGTSRLLLEVSKMYKEQQTRFAPNDMVANMDIQGIKAGGRSVGFFDTDIFGDPAHFPGWGDHLFMIDIDAIKIGGQTGMPFVDLGKSLTNRLLSFSDPRGSRDDIFSYPVEMTLCGMLIDPGQASLLQVDGFA